MLTHMVEILQSGRIPRTRIWHAGSGPFDADAAMPLVSSLQPFDVRPRLSKEKALSVSSPHAAATLVFRIDAVLHRNN